MAISIKKRKVINKGIAFQKLEEVYMPDLKESKKIKMAENEMSKKKKKLNFSPPLKTNFPSLYTATMN